MKRAEAFEKPQQTGFELLKTYWNPFIVALTSQKCGLVVNWLHPQKIRF